MASGEFEMRRSLPVLFIAVLAILLSACTQITYVNWDDLFPEENERKLSADELLERLDIPGIIEIAAGSGTVPDGISITPASGASITASRADSVLTARIISFDEYKANGITVVSGSLRVSFLGAGSSVNSFSFVIGKDLMITSGDSNQYSYNVATENKVKGKISATFDNGTLKGGKGAVIDFSSSLVVDNKVVQADGAKGDGSQRNPYVLTTASQLFSFAAAYNSGDIAPDHKYIYAELGADINLGEKQWTPIGTTTRDGHEFAKGERAFRGSFDGNGHSITGFSINDDSFVENAGIGLFSAITGENTVVKGVRIQGTISSASNGSAGFISGLLADKATIDDCIVLAGSSIETKEAGETFKLAIITICAISIKAELNILLSSSGIGVSYINNPDRVVTVLGVDVKFAGLIKGHGCILHIGRVHSAQPSLELRCHVRKSTFREANVAFKRGGRHLLAVFIKNHKPHIAFINADRLGIRIQK